MSNSADRKIERLANQDWQTRSVIRSDDWKNLNSKTNGLYTLSGNQICHVIWPDASPFSTTQTSFVLNNDNDSRSLQTLRPFSRPQRLLTASSDVSIEVGILAGNVDLEITLLDSSGSTIDTPTVLNSTATVSTPDYNVTTIDVSPPLDEIIVFEFRARSQDGNQAIIKELFALENSDPNAGDIPS